jgi:hypothetical protein
MRFVHEQQITTAVILWGALEGEKEYLNKALVREVVIGIGPT